MTMTPTTMVKQRLRLQPRRRPTGGKKPGAQEKTWSSRIFSSSSGKNPRAVRHQRILEFFFLRQRKKNSTSFARSESTSEAERKQHDRSRMSGVVRKTDRPDQPARQTTQQRNAILVLLLMKLSMVKTRSSQLRLACCFPLPVFQATTRMRLLY